MGAPGNVHVKDWGWDDDTDLVATMIPLVRPC